MKIFLPFALQDIGGTSSFAAKFKLGMERRGHAVSFVPGGEYDLLFLIVQAPAKHLLAAKRRGKPIVQRLDGTYYPAVSGWKFPLMNAKALLIRQLAADATVYQSVYSKRCADRFLGAKRGGRAALVYNGVDLSVFTPRGPAAALRDHAGQHVFFTASAFRRADQILPLIAAIEEYRRTVQADAKLVVAGSFVGPVRDVPARYRAVPYLSFLGKIPNGDLPRYARGADVFVFTHLNPPCPNNVLEAMACGLPICGIADGAMPELVRHQVDGWLLPVRGDGFRSPRPIGTGAFVRQMAAVQANATRLGAAARQAAERRFGLDAMIAGYERLFEAVA